MVNNVALTVQTRNLQRFIGNTQNQMIERGNEVSTGKKQDLVKDLGGEIRNFLDLNSTRSELISREGRLQTADNRFAQVGISYELLQQQTGGFNDLVAQAELLDRNSLDIFIDQAGSTLEQVKATLNTQWGGRYLLSGDSVLNPPVSGFDTLQTAVETVISDHALAAGGTLTTTDEIDAMIAEIDSIFDNTHPTNTYDTLAYNGGAGVMAGIEISEGSIMAYDTKANDPEIKNMIKGLVMLSAADDLRNSLTDPIGRTPSDVEKYYIAKTTSTIFQSGRDLVDKRASIGFKQQRINDTLEGISDTKFHYEQRLAIFENADPYEASIAFTELQRQLESSFYVTAQLTSQSLLNYL